MSNPLELELLELLEPELLPLLGRLELFELPELLDEELLPELVLLLGFLLLDMALLTAPAAAPAIPAINDAKLMLFKPPVFIANRYSFAFL